MKKIALVFLSVLLCFTSIAKNQKRHKKKQQEEIISVGLNRTGCFGHCPTYMIEITKDGMVTYTAIRFNADSGTFRKSIGVAKAANLINEVNKYQPDTCKDTYRNYIPDLPGIILVIKYSNKTKNISNATYGPPFLQHLGKLIEDAGKKTDDSGWERVTTLPGTK